MNRKIHHVGKSKTMQCKACKKYADMYWFDEKEENGQSETFNDYLCSDCYVKKNGERPKTLQELNDERDKTYQQ